MVLIMPEPGKHCRSADVALLLASLRQAITTHAGDDVSGLCYHVLGNTIVVEGIISDRKHEATMRGALAGGGEILP